ncbi:MAG: ATP-binding protein [Deltaproteobacteria bacterium]|nr:ATP-binding protein [Deltaproteobacteria bacterium]
MYIPRSIDKNLVSWVERPNRLPLILRGARQVGKTAAVMALGRSSGLFDNVVKIDFEEEPGLARVFAGSLKAELIVRDLEAVTGQPIKAGKTLLFFDEVQECPRAISALRYFREQMPKLHVVAAGSLLEFVLGDVSMPVGRVEYMYVRPMSFGEFLHATGRGLLDSRRPNIISWTGAISSSAIEAETLDSALKEYVIVGGMPEAVSTYVNTKSFIETARVHDRLLRSFRDDIPKYAQGDLQRANLTQSLLALAVSVAQQITYTKLVDDDAKRTKLSVQLLEQAMVVSIARATSAAGLPLGAGVSSKTLKPIYLDVGLMQRACGRTAGQVLESKNLLADFKGQIAEQVIGQELLVQRGGSENEQLYFWQRAERGSTAEVDFLLSCDGEIVPIEVKSGPSGRLRSLHLFLNSHSDISVGYCLQQRVILEQVGKIRFAPLWSRLE